MSCERMEGVIAAEEAARRVAEKKKKHQHAVALRAQGLSRAEINERTGIPLSTLAQLFRGLGRRS